jgi:urease accessory protein UreH
MSEVRSATHVKLPRSHYNAIRRVLRLSEIYFDSLGGSLMSAGGGMMTGDELAAQCKAARGLMPVKRRKK